MLNLNLNLNLNINELLLRNQRWADRMSTIKPNFFERLKNVQKPKFLWIGCSDSRVPASQVLDLKPGEIFTHRNIANIVHEDDLNCLSVLEYAVNVLQVEHIIVCGHYGCGGIKAAMQGSKGRLVDRWLQPISKLYAQHKEKIVNLDSDEERSNHLCEINVRSQVCAVVNSEIIKKALRSGHTIQVHGWVYDVGSGRINSLEII